jgi:indole-3-acetate monooxygenase
VLFPKSSTEIIDNWQVIGLRGTGSDSYRATTSSSRQKYTLSRDNEAERREGVSSIAL